MAQSGRSARLAFPGGALMIAMFMVPNRFTDAEDRKIGMLGDDWETKWRAALE